MVHARPYRPNDHAGVVAVFVPGLMANASLPGQTHALWSGLVANALKTDLGNIDGEYFASGGHFWVAVVDHEDGGERVVGIVGLQRKSGSEGELRRMSVDASHRRFGVGRLLTQTLEDWARANGLQRVVLKSAHILEKAHGLYTTMGYTQFKDEVVSQDPLFIRMYFEKLLK